MGIDGFSLANLSLNINKTSSAMAAEAEILAREGNENQIKDVDGISKKQKTLRKDKDGAFNGGVYLPGEEGEFLGDSMSEDGEDADGDESQEESLTEEELSSYHFRLNSDHMIEIFDSKSDEIIRVIRPEDAARVLMNVSDVPGFIVNESA